MANIPAVVEQIPVVLLHSDMGLHNIIVSHSNPSDIVAIIDWEFCASSPYACIDPVIEPLFRTPAGNNFGTEYPRADDLRSAFWEAIPSWQQCNKSEATTVFREWYRFALFMRAGWQPGLAEEEKEEFWSENVRVVERFLAKYHVEENAVL